MTAVSAESTPPDNPSTTLEPALFDIITSPSTMPGGSIRHRWQAQTIPLGSNLASATGYLFQNPSCAMTFRPRQHDAAAIEDKLVVATNLIDVTPKWAPKPLHL